MYLFIATIFIAELIIAGFILSLILKADKNVKKYILMVSDKDKGLIPTIKELRKVVKLANNTICNSLTFVVKKRKEFLNKLMHLGLIYLCIVLFKTKFKRTATLLQYALLVKDFWSSIPV